MFLLIFRFGVCCLFIVSSTSTTISENCTYIQNPSYPSVYSDTSSLTYTINKCSSSVCAVRLDFETFQTAGPAATTEASGGLCVGMKLKVAIYFRRNLPLPLFEFSCKNFQAAELLTYVWFMSFGQSVK